MSICHTDHYVVFFLHTKIEFRTKSFLFLRIHNINMRPILFVSTLNYYCNALKYLPCHKFCYYLHTAGNSSHDNDNKKLFRYSCIDDYLIGRHSFLKANSNQDKYTSVMFQTINQSLIFFYFTPFITFANTNSAFTIEKFLHKK